MTNKTAALRYARALLEVGIAERADLQAIERDVASFAALLDEHPELARVLLNPAVPAPRKRSAVAELAGRLGLAPSVAKLVVLLAERDRLVLVPDLLSAYRERLLDHLRVVRAEVTTAAALPADRADALRAGLAKMTGRTVTLATRVDPTIVGGVIARVGSVVYDGSVTRQLERMKEKLVAGS